MQVYIHISLAVPDIPLCINVYVGPNIDFRPVQAINLTFELDAACCYPWHIGARVTRNGTELNGTKHIYVWPGQCTLASRRVGKIYIIPLLLSLFTFAKHLRRPCRRFNNKDTHCMPEQLN